MGLTVVSQFGAEFDAVLRAHPLRPTVIAASDARPWEGADAADVLLIRPTPAWRAHLSSARPTGWPGRLRWVHSASAGVDYYPRWLFDTATVTCGRGLASEEIADYAIAAIYGYARNMEAVRVTSPDAWTFRATGRIVGSMVGLIGFGSIGTAIARRALALGARVTAARRRNLPSPVAGVDMVDDLSAVVASADHLVVAVPSTPETRHLMGAALLAHAKPTAHIINVARGAVLDQDALIAALDAGRLGFATLDVTDPEPLPAGHRLWTHPRVRLTPHIASNFSVVRERMFVQTIADFERYARGETPGGIVDVSAGY